MCYRWELNFESSKKYRPPLLSTELMRADQTTYTWLHTAKEGLISFGGTS